jgi:hypothetical protein
VSIRSSIEGKSFVNIVTAGHVAEAIGDKEFALRINTLEGSSAFVGGKDSNWFRHPTQPSVDVAVLPYSPDHAIFDYKTIPVGMFLTDDLVKQKQIGAGDEVFITSLFAHVAGSKRNIPIVRTGNIAVMPDELVPINQGEAEAYLIEARSIGGLSGSPVIVRETMPVGLGRGHLLGLVQGHWEIPPMGKNDLMDKDLSGTVNMGIAIVVPAKKILEVLNHPDLVKMRAGIEDSMQKQAIGVDETATPNTKT